ncbi:DUF4143 domain-containing protein [Patescibacteria group bacterium]|nr:DUF4143 domain-containing protein [Patescibacteria group bacterium]
MTWLTGEISPEQKLESAVASHLLHRKNAQLYYWRRNYEVDCVVEENNELIPIEAKTGSRQFRASEYRGLINFMKKYQVKLGLVIYQGEAEEINREGLTIRMLPAWYALTQLA